MPSRSAASPICSRRSNRSWRTTPTARCCGRAWRACSTRRAGRPTRSTGWRRSGVSFATNSGSTCHRRPSNSNVRSSTTTRRCHRLRGRPGRPAPLARRPGLGCRRCARSSAGMRSWPLPSTASRQTRVITLIGPGGIGKTSVAAHIAATFGTSCRDGACFVDLTNVPAGHDPLVARQRPGDDAPGVTTCSMRTSGRCSKPSPCSPAAPTSPVCSRSTAPQQRSEGGHSHFSTASSVDR